MLQSNLTVTIPYEHGYQRLYSPIWQAVEYEKKVFYQDVEETRKYTGDPRPELEEAWANITEGHLILLNETGVKALGQSLDDAVNLDERYFALPEYYHQMHCLDIVRRFIRREHYPDFTIFRGSDQSVLEHVGMCLHISYQVAFTHKAPDHCVDLLRRVIMCNADVGMIVYYWEGPGRDPKAELATEHMCRNIDRINDWVLANSWSGETFSQNRTFLQPSAKRIDGRLFSLNESQNWQLLQPPSPAVDAAWDRLSAEGREIITVSSETLRVLGYDPALYFQAPADWGFNSGSYPVQIDVFHQIHCLDTIRKFAHHDYYFPNGTNPMLDPFHMAHCMNILLQNIMCHADTDIIPHRWVEANRHPMAQFSITKQCKQFDQLLELNDQYGKSVTNAMWAAAEPSKGAYTWNGWGE
ncbi:hypothetical protein KCU67_g1499, partial [Aureobasidium melanogenum]